MKLEQGRRPDILNTYVELLQGYSAGGKWWETIATATTVLELTKGNHTEALNHRGRAHRCTKNQYFAILDFKNARRLARKESNQELELIATVGLVDAWRTSSRDPNFLYPERYQTEKEKNEYGLKQAVRWARIAQSLINQMPAGFTEAKAAAYDNFGLLFTEPNIGNHQKALEAYLPAEDGLRKLLENDPKNLSLQERLARTVHLKGIALENLGRLPEAEARQRESLETSQRMEHRRNIGNASISLGDVRNKLGHPDEAYTYYNQALNVAQKDGEITDSEIYDLASKRLNQMGQP